MKKYDELENMLDRELKSDSKEPSKEFIDFWNQVRIANEKLNDPECNEERVLKVRANHVPSYTKEVFY